MVAETDEAAAHWPRLLRRAPSCERYQRATSRTFWRPNRFPLASELLVSPVCLRPVVGGVQTPELGERVWTRS